LDQRCTYNNCKSWDYWSGAVSAKDCNACWETEDLKENDWYDLTRIPKIQIEARNELKPYYYNPYARRCELNCKDNYWSSK